MTIYNIEFLKHEEVAEGTMAFHFKKPEGFSFKAGQFADFTLINPKETDEEGNVRGFSLTNPPYENDIMIATRMRDTAFKRNLKSLPSGSILKFDAPYGSFTLHNNSETPAVFLTGGIGITPVRSIVLQAAKDKLPHHIFLFYSNKRPEDAAFLEELEVLEKENSNYKFIGTMTDMEKSHQKWAGETGYINKEMLLKHVHDLKKPIYYISGPAAMVAAMRQTLNAAGVDDDNIRTEEFSGY
ncbi:MAG: FAD-dependent oxidoreductase [Alphaproteobacteria bacterium]|nr:FAD-dependent oxidoreductase [Alphaproteobacteria bacterium]